MPTGRIKMRVPHRAIALVPRMRLLLLILTLTGVCFAQQPADPAPSSGAGQPADKSDQKQENVHVLEDGTPVRLRLTKALSSAEAKTGQEIQFEAEDDIDVDGVTVLRRGTIATGIVSDAAAKKRMGRAGRLDFTITSIPLVDGEKAGLRAVNDTKGDSHVQGMVNLMVNMPLVSAPFFLLMKGSDVAFPKGAEITAFINGDVRLDMTKFNTGSASTTPEK